MSGATASAVTFRPPRLAAAIHGSGPLLPLNSRIVYIGDSITAEGSWEGYVDLADLIGGGRYYTPNGFNLGVSGNSSAQILARIPNALALNPAVLVIEGGVNDATDPTSQAATIANLTSAYQSALSAGARVVGVSILPDGNNFDAHGTVNAFIQSRPFGITCAYNTPGWNTPVMTFGDLHPNLIGAPIYGANVAACITSLISTASIFTVTTGQLSPNPTMSGSVTPPAVGSNPVGTGVVPTGFRLYETTPGYTTSMVGSQDIAGNGSNEEIITITNGSGGTASVIFDLPNITINGNTGDLFESWFEADVVQSSGFIALQPYFASSTLFGGQSVTPPGTIQVLNGVYRTIPAALGSGLTTTSWQLTFQLSANGSCQVKIHDLMVRKVPSGQ